MKKSYELLKNALSVKINLFDVPIIDERLRLVTPGKNSTATVKELMAVIDKAYEYIGDVEGRIDNMKKLISGELKSSDES